MANPWVACSKYNIHAEASALTDLLISNGAKPFSMYSLEDARKVFLDICIKAGGDFTFDGEVKEMAVPSPHAKAGIPISVYKPNKMAATPAILIYFHGGGLVLWERKCFDSALKKISQDSGSIIINVEYRLLPDQCKGTGPFDDGVLVAKWVLDKKTTVFGQPGSKVGIGGDSSGGQIAISVTNDVKGLDFMVLVYPHCDVDLTKPSIKELENCPILPGVDLKWFTDLVSKDLPNYATDPRLCALARTDLKSLPPALFIQAQIDPLRDGGLAFAENLRAAGVKVRLVMIEGVPHVFFGMREIFKTKCEEAYGHIVKFLKEFQ